MTTQNPADITAEIDINGIQRLIPHRYPFLLVDRLVDIVKGERAVGIKNVTINEPFFEGHFPARPIMPGVLIVESMAQTAGCLVLHTLGTDADNKLVYFMTIDDARFRRPVTPGDQMRILWNSSAVAAMSLSSKAAPPSTTRSAPRRRFRR